MSHNPMMLQEGTLFVADAHYAAHQRPALLELLRSIANGATPTPQLILMGDIFDLLFGPIPLTHERNAEAIKSINQIAAQIPVLYLEGNHDFGLASLFPEVQVVSIAQQPVHATFGSKRVLLAHGDFIGPWKYRLYTQLIRSKAMLSMLRWIDRIGAHAIIKRLDAYLVHKNDCAKIEGFETLVKQRLSTLDLTHVDVMIEGHFHQNQTLQLGHLTYINLGAFACNERYFRLESMPNNEIMLKEEQW